MSIASLKTHGSAREYSNDAARAEQNSTGACAIKCPSAVWRLFPDCFYCTYGCICLVRGRYSRRFPGWKRTCDFEKRRNLVLVETSRRFVEGFENQGVTNKEVRHHFVSVHFARVRFSSGLNSMQKLFGTKKILFLQ